MAFATNSKDVTRQTNMVGLGIDVDVVNARREDLVRVTASTLALTEADHAGRLVILDQAAGVAVTLPASTGSGLKFRLLLGTTVTSNSTTIKVANSSDTMIGFATQFADSGSTANFYEIGSTTDTITLNGTTTGGIAGDYTELTDIGNNLWFVRHIQSATGTEATPLSASVS